MSIPVSFWTPSEDDSGLIPYSTDDWMIDNEYEEIYNGEGREPGVEREYDGKKGRFYQTCGGPGGWGGYWVVDAVIEHTYKVEGEVFTLLKGKRLSISGVPYFPASIHWWCKVV